MTEDTHGQITARTEANEQTTYHFSAVDDAHPEKCREEEEAVN